MLPMIYQVLLISFAQIKGVFSAVPPFPQLGTTRPRRFPSSLHEIQMICQQTQKPTKRVGVAAAARGVKAVKRGSCFGQTYMYISSLLWLESLMHLTYEGYLSLCNF